MEEEIQRCIEVVGTTCIPGMKLGKGGTITDMDGTLIATLNTVDWTVAEVHAFAAYFINAPRMLTHLQWAEERRQEDGT